MINPEDSDFDNFVLGTMDTTYSTFHADQTITSDTEDILLHNLSEIDSLSDSDSSKPVNSTKVTHISLDHPVVPVRGCSTPLPTTETRDVISDEDDSLETANPVVSQRNFSGKRKRQTRTIHYTQSLNSH